METSPERKCEPEGSTTTASAPPTTRYPPPATTVTPPSASQPLRDLVSSPRAKAARAFDGVGVEASPRKRTVRAYEFEAQQGKEIPETPAQAVDDGVRSLRRSRSPTSTKDAANGGRMARSPSPPAPHVASSSTPGSYDSPPPSPFHWHHSEITGHLPNDDPDDDGRGINGIGFRPTAAVAHARASKRAQQVREWRARETMDERRRRAARRRNDGQCCGLGDNTAESEAQRLVDMMRETGRSVRFAGDTPI